MNHSKNSLGRMLELLRDLDEDMLSEDFDPAKLIGDIRDKVDAIKWKLNDWEYRALMIEEEFVLPLQVKIKAILGKRERLKNYVTSEMKRLEVEKIPGNMFKVQLQNSPRSVELKADADERMYLNYPEFVLQETTYKWDKENLKSHLEAGESFTFAELKQGKHIRFYTSGTFEDAKV